MPPKEGFASTVSIVLPFSNSESDVLAVVEETHQRVTALIPGAEIIAVDDHSQDHTWAILRELTRAYDELKIFRLREPAGSGACSVRGFIEATGNYVFHREPHCPWKMDVFWELARKRADLGSGVIFGARNSNLRGFKEKAMERLFRDDVLENWPVEVPDPNFPVQLFSKNDFEKVHILMPERALSPGLVLYLLFSTFEKDVVLVTPGSHLEKPGRRKAQPAWFASFGSFKEGIGQVKDLKKNLDRIVGLLEI